MMLQHYTPILLQSFDLICTVSLYLAIYTIHIFPETYTSKYVNYINEEICIFLDLNLFDIYYTNDLEKVIF